MRVEADFLAAAFWYAWGCGWLFLVGYSRMTPWWERRAGWVAASHGVADLCFTTPFLLHYLWHWVGTESWFLWYFVGSELMAGSIELARLYLVWSLQPGRRKSNP
jgi:hypothetical protein